MCAVNDYLQLMGIPTNLNSGDCWNPVVRLFDDVADLEVEQVGRLECRVIKASEPLCYVPPEVWSDRVGYVVVQLDELNQEATILGFVKQVVGLKLDINSLQPLEDLLVHLSQLAAAVAFDYAHTVNLSQWLQNMFEQSWQTVESVLNPLTFSFRKANNQGNVDSEYREPDVRRAKLIDLGMQLSGHSIALVVELKPESLEKTGILLQLHPAGSQIFLPPLVQLIVLDETGAIFLEAKSRRADNYIQLQFSGTAGERFSVKVALGEVSITESFVI